jgi:uncharacterized membrane protein
MLRNYFYYAGLSGFFSLFFLMMAWHTLLAAPSRLPTGLLIIISAGPLLLPFSGFLNRNLKHCTWMTYLSLPYFIHGVIEAYADPGLRSWALLEVLSSLFLCFGAGFYVYTAEKA